jgi:hypothetical protein
MSFVFPLSIYLDPRNRHSPELLPINAAAICNSVGFSKRAGARSTSSSASPRSASFSSVDSAEGASLAFAGRGISGGRWGSPSEAVEASDLAAPRSSSATFSVGFYLSAEPSADLAARLRNTAAFLGPFCCGLETSVNTSARFDDAAFTERLLAASSAHIAVIVLLTKKDAEDWLAGPSRSWPESQTVLCAPFEGVISDCVELQKYWCLLLPSVPSPTEPGVLGALRRSTSAALAAVGRGAAAAVSNDLSPYRGFAASLIDAIGSKVGHSFFAASRAKAVKEAAQEVARKASAAR